ncbi:MAG: hypothetical protein LBJ61_01135 [Deltaproteobacteria bacterium]|nr:hypothetical protein [Deltaproteobacteria bacterium]
MFAAALLALSLAIPLALAGCAMPKQANDIVLTPLPEDWKDRVLIALAPKATDDLLVYDSNQVEFPDNPRPCVLTPDDSAKGQEPLKGHCGTLVVAQKGRRKLPPANYMYILQESGEIIFIRQD